MFQNSQEPLEPEFSPAEKERAAARTGHYETGNIDPPRHYGGFIAALLLILIFCGGMVGAVLLRILAPVEDSQEEMPDTAALLSADLLPDRTVMDAVEDTAPTYRDAEDGPDLELHQSPNAVPNVAQEGGLSLQEIYKKVSPCVVSITADKASGSGIIMSESGYIITNCHVVSGSSQLTVTLADNRVIEAQLVGKDNLSDLAVLHIEATGLSAAEFGDSESVQVGDAVTAIGDPLGIEFRGTMTEGIVSAINRNLDIQGRSMTLIQTTAALNEGNSGGPLINCYGQVIGINTAKIGSYYSTSGVEGLGFAIPINIAKDVVDQLIDVGYVPGRPCLGVETTVLSYEYQMWFGLPDGLYITDVAEGSEAWRIGLRTGDVITHVDGSRITCDADLTAALNSHSAGDDVEIVIYRSHRQYKGTLELQEAGG